MPKGKAYVPAGDLPGQWRNIPGYNGKYQASLDGEVRRVFQKSGKVRRMHPYVHASDAKRSLVIKLTKEDGKSEQLLLAKVLASAWLLPPLPGQVLHHVNGLVRDNRVSNLAWISRYDLGCKTALLANRRRPVVKVDARGNEVAFYESARAAARANNMSYQTVLDRCHHRVKKNYALDGHDYQFDE